MFTKDNGEIVTQQYLRTRVTAKLSRLRRLYSLQERRAVIARTLDNPEWMAGRNGQTVGSLEREIEREL